MGLLNTIRSGVLELIFPSLCLSCGKRGTFLCDSCLSGSPAAERECAEWIFPIFDYRHPPIKKSVHMLKYKGRKQLAKIFADSMHARILEELSDLSIMQNFRDPLLIPIPLSFSRYRERGFNQAEIICKELVKLGAENFILVKNVLFRKDSAKHQAHIENRAERLRNIIGSFYTKNENLIKGRNIILIDDVITTGATLTEAKKILKNAGARKIIAVTCAH